MNRTMKRGVHAVTVAIVGLIAAPKAIALSLMFLAQSASPGQFAEGGPTDFNALREATEKALAKIGDQVKEVGEKALAEAKKAGDMSAQSKEKVDELLVKQGELQANLLDVQQKLARRGEQEQSEKFSIGERVAKSAEFGKWMQDGGMRAPNSGFLYQIKAAITSTATTNTTTVGVPPDEQPLVPGTQRALRIRDLIMPGQTESNSISFVRETGFTNNAATVSESNLKPESSITYEWVQKPVVTVAHFVKTSKQILDDFKQLQSNIDGRLRYGLKFKEEAQLLKGSGVGNNLEGIYTAATAYSAPIVVASATKIDVLRLMLLQAELAEYPATGIVLHPSDWAVIELKKETTVGYIFANPQALATPRLWGRPIVTTQAMTVDTALVGAFDLGAQLFDREEINVVIATQNEDDFVKNMITIRCEERLALAIYRPEAFVKNADLPAT